ncbi:MAG: hemerythrin domain-containing protein [Deltaproteobacteria bacterium]|nr:hemerythrin domain-containing protein [Deltaproteobacteria bacterium]
MAMLIDELKSQHKELADALESVRVIGAATRDGQMKLGAIKSKLLDHLKKEDMELYPVLKKAAENDKILAKILDTLARDMDGVSKAALAFFERYSNPASASSTEFSADFSGFVGALKARIQREESMLYREYTKVAK